MNSNAPFSGQPPSIFQAPPNKSSSGMIQVQPPLQFGQLSLFGPNSGGGVKNPGFTPASDFTRTSELHGSSGQSLGFGQPLGFTQSYPFGHATSFVATSTPTSSSIAGKQGFSFKLPTNLGASQASSAFGSTSGKNSGSVFTGPDFSFKIPKNAMSKPIFGIGSEPEKTQSQTIPNPFTFSFSGESGSGRLAPFGISQETSSSSASTHFSFSKPVSSITTLSSSFPATLPSKTVEDDKKGPINPFANPSSSFGGFSFQSGLALARPSVLQKEEENKAKQEEKSSVSNPSRRNWNSGSTESFRGLPPSELKSFLCKNIPDYLNDRRVLENHFKKFVKIHYIDVNRSKKRAIVHCLDHSSGVLARKKVKLLHKEIVTFWLKKKPNATREQRMQQGLCLKCGEQGHFATDCGQKTQWEKQESTKTPAKKKALGRPKFAKALQASPEEDEGDSSETEQEPAGNEQVLP